MPSTQTSKQLLQSLTPELRPILIEKTESKLLTVVRANLNTQYASKTPLLSEFRAAISAHGSTSDSDLVNDFRRFVPLSEYDAYKPFMAAFDATTCKEVEVENLFAPGFPFMLAVSSATSGREPKLIPKYNSRLPCIFSGKGLVAPLFFYGYREVKYVEREPGQIVHRIIVSNGSSGKARARLGWTNVDEDDSRMPVIAPGFVAPFAASMIADHKSFLMVHALFTLACRDVARFMTTFSTLFYDFVRCIDEEWDLLLTSIKNGTVPHLPGVDELHPHLQASFHANPDRAAELFEIGPPSLCEGWAPRVWPKLTWMSFACGGPFASVLPKVKSITGPTITIYPHGYVCSECEIGVPFQADYFHAIVLSSPDLIEFLDVSAEESHRNLLQAWELEVGKQYEIILTTGDGLWRYRLGDVINVVGFDADNGSPVFVLSGRRSLAIRLAPVLIVDTDIISAIQALSPDLLQVNEFTTLPDDRQSPPTVGYLVELAGSPGPNAHLAPQRVCQGIGAANAEFWTAFQDKEVGVPSIRILKTGTFAAFRQWKVARINVGPGQLKVPAVLLDEASKEWILERVVGEL